MFTRLYQVHQPTLALNGYIVWSIIVLLLGFATSATTAQVTTETGVCGVGAPGLPGLPGRDGRDGRDGQSVQGPKGEAGVPGDVGAPGSTSNCDCPLRAIKQCSWSQLNDGTDLGMIKDCYIDKVFNHTALRAAWNGDLRVYSDTSGMRCNRWFFTFDGHECDNPHTIDAIVVSTENNNNEHRPAMVEGICASVPKGLVRVAFNIGKCDGAPPGNAHTGWTTTSRMIMEEVLLQD